MKLSISYSGVLNVFFVIACMYVCVPFYFNRIETFHKILYYMYAIVPITFSLINKMYSNRERIIAFASMGFTFLYVLFLTISNPGDSAAYLIYCIRYIVGMAGMLSTYTLWRKSSKIYSLISFEEIFIRSAILYICGTIVFMFFRPVKYFWENMIVNYSLERVLTAKEYGTRYGFAGFSGYLVSIYMTMALIAALIFSSNNTDKSRRGDMYILFLMVGSLLYSRTGALISIVIVVIYALYNLFRRADARTIILIAKVTFIAGLGILIIYKLIPRLQKSIDWMLEIIINYGNQRKIGTLSSQGVLAFYRNFHPDVQTLLYGTGVLRNDTDIGFMREIYFGGIPYTIVVYGMLLIFVAGIFRKMKRNYMRTALFFSVILIVSMVGFELKGQADFYYLRFLAVFLFSIGDHRFDNIRPLVNRKKNSPVSFNISD